MLHNASISTEILLREPGGDEGHLEGIWEGVEGVEGLRVHGPHDGEGPSVLRHPAKLKNEYFYITILLSTHTGFITG